jgi:STE24 endopeptidase
VVGAAVSVAIGVATLPLSAVARERARHVGLVTQSWPGYLEDFAKSQAIAAALAGTGAALLVLGMRRMGSRWWIAGTVIVVAYGAAITYAGPVLLDPLFNRFDRLPSGSLRSEVLDLARRAGVDVGQVLVVDASRRTTAANAYVVGIGHTKRVVIYDNLIKDFKPEELRFVVAHELGHVAHDDLPRGLLFLVIIAPLGAFAVARIAERLGARPGAEAVAPVALALALAVPVLQIPGNQQSRAVERSADAFALELTRDPRAQIDFQRRITIQNVGDPDPPGWAQFILGTHPTALQRIGQALAFSEGRTADRRSPEGS